MSRSTELTRDALALERQENRAARLVAQPYTQARRELIDYLLRAWTGPQTITPRDALDLWRRLGLLHNVEARLRQLSAQVGTELGGIVTNASEQAIETIERQMMLLPPELRPNLRQFTAIHTAMVERFVPLALAEVQGITANTAITLGSAIQNGLIQGESFPQLITRLMAFSPTGEAPAIWRRGELSAELMTRRLVITADNAAKVEALTQINATGGVQIRKQAVAHIAGNTTDTCLRVHGQIQDVDVPFKLTGTPRFADTMQYPAFHWRCRTSTAMYHPVFERGGMTTPAMRSSAAAELKRRDSNAGKEL